MTTVLVAALTAAACSSAGQALTAPSNPQAMAPALAGVWKGGFELTSCSGSYFDCRPAPDSFALHVGADGRGVIQIDTRLWSSAPPVAANVTAFETEAGSVALISQVPGARNLEVGLTLSRVGAALDGTVTYGYLGVGGAVRKEGRILYSARDVTVRYGRLDGAWVGFVTRTECAGDCTDYDPVLNANAVRLELSQSGTTVSGRFNSEELTGSGLGNRLTATSHREVAAGACRPGWDEGTICLVDLAIDATADSLDRLSGSITYRVEAVHEYGRHYAFSARGELAGIVRWP